MKSLLTEEIRNKISSLDSEPRRLLHGRGATLPGYEFLVIDWYPPIVLVTLYDSRSEEWLLQLGEEIKGLTGDKVRGIVIQNRREANGESRILYGSVPEPCIIEEDGLRFAVEPLAKQNIGFFPDMRPGRQLVRRVAEEKRVLNLFAYTCGFSVAAIAGGARQVTNLDMNRSLLERGRENHRLNRHDLRDVAFLSHNLFKSFGKLQRLGPFDLVIIDPPLQQGSSFQAERDWPKIMKKIPGLLAADGEIIAAVSAPELGRSFLHEQFSCHLPEAECLAELTGGDDFPEADADKGLQIQQYRLRA